MKTTVTFSQPTLIFILTAALLAGAPILRHIGSQPAAAQISDQPLSNVVPQNEAITFQAKITKIDANTRAVSLQGSSGEAVTVTAGPGVRLELLKPGDTVNARYYRSVAFVLTPPGQPVPNDEIAAVLARPVTAPGGLALRETRISGTVVGTDLSTNCLKVIDPSGGRVWTVHVTDPKRQAALPMIKVGDTITAVVSETLAVAIDPVGR